MLLLASATEVVVGKALTEDVVAGVVAELVLATLDTEVASSVELVVEVPTADGMLDRLLLELEQVLLYPTGQQ